MKTPVGLTDRKEVKKIVAQGEPPFSLKCTVTVDSISQTHTENLSISRYGACPSTWHFRTKTHSISHQIFIQFRTKFHSISHQNFIQFRTKFHSLSHQILGSKPFNFAPNFHSIPHQIPFNFAPNFSVKTI